MLYRIRQFIKALTASVSTEERQWIVHQLSTRECELFFQLKIYEQRHCIDVAQILAKHTHENREMIRLGLLHDIGKIMYPLNPIEKSIMVILDKITKGSAKRWASFKMVKCYYQHAEIGYRLLKDLDEYDERFLARIKEHHSMEVDDEVLELLKNADDSC